MRKKNVQQSAPQIFKGEDSVKCDREAVSAGEGGGRSTSAEMVEN